MNISVDQKPVFYYCDGKVIMLLHSRVSSVTNLNLYDMVIKISKVTQIGNFSCEVLQESQTFLTLLPHKLSQWIIMSNHNRFYRDNITVSAWFQVSLYFHYLRLCQDLAKFAQSEALGSKGQSKVLTNQFL